MQIPLDVGIVKSLNRSTSAFGKREKDIPRKLLEQKKREKNGADHIKLVSKINIFSS